MCSNSASCSGLGRNLREAKKAPLLRVGPFIILKTATTVWLIAQANKGLKIGIRLFDAPNGFFKTTARASGNGALLVGAEGGLGQYSAVVRCVQGASLCFRITVSLRPSGSVELGRLPRQVCLLDSGLEPLERGMIYTFQTEATAGHAFVSAQDAYVFYFQNLSALSAYSAVTESGLGGAVSIAWPELGLSIPAGKKPLFSEHPVILSDAFLRVCLGVSSSESFCACRFMDDLHATYLQLSLPAVEWYDWELMAARTVSDLSRSKKCMRTIHGVPYLNPYVGCTSKPPESMVQAAVSVPLIEYQTWLGKSVPLVKRLDKTLLTFYNEKLGSIVRWLPGVPFEKDDPSEEENSNLVDSWYLFHSLLNVARLAGKGKEAEMGIFLNSLPYAIRTAHHFNYDWPVFYDQRSLKAVKEETARGAGGEQDTPRLYTHLMMQAWQITRDPLYLEEAEIAARKLEGLGFGVLYQTNNTMFTCIALAWLWKETGNARYKELSFVCMGSILSHLWMWEAETPDRHWQTFMGLPPLHDAPYIAAYEEGEVYAGSQAYLEAMGSELPESITSLLVEYGKRLLNRARFYYPSEMPAGSVCTDPREGCIESALAIPVEDLYSASDKCGQVGQEVYGAALALILATRSYHHWSGVPFRLWCNGLLLDAEFANKGKLGGTICFRLGGVSECEYEIRIFPQSIKGRSISIKMKYSYGSGIFRPKTLLKNEHNHLLYRANGGAKAEICWQYTQ